MSKIIDRIAALPLSSNFFSLEFFPPKTSAGFENLLPRLQRLRALQPLFVCVTFSAGGSTASRSLELADLCQNQLNLTTCLHLTCTNMKAGTVDEVLRSCKKLGVRNILALRGDEPREGEYALDDATAAENGGDGVQHGENRRFKYAVDLIRYIREQHGDYFCIGAAAYPEGHPTPSPAHPGGFYQSPEHDLPHLVEKVKAGADFLLTQLFYDVNKYLAFEKLLRTPEYDGVFDKVPIIPGLMPAHGWQSFSRTIKLARVGIPMEFQKKFQALRGDDEGVKDAGVKVVTEIVNTIKESRRPQRRFAQGFHFYTLNLEKAVAQILEGSELLPPPTTEEDGKSGEAGLQSTITINVTSPTDDSASNKQQTSTANRRRRSSTKNRVIASSTIPTGQKTDDYVIEEEAGKPRSEADEDSLAIAEGEGSLGRAATWDDFPNGRWGDARSPAYNSTANYALHPNLTPSLALSLWATPTSNADITSIFQRYLLGSLPCNPWSEDPPSPETATIKAHLMALNTKNWWTLASQPAVNGVSSGHSVFGWGPKQGGFVYQKPFVEFFLPASDWTKLRKKLDQKSDEFTYFAGNASGAFEASDEGSVNPVTWGCFKGKEIVTPTIIEAVSFREWQGEAFGIWREWREVFCAKREAESARLLDRLREELWLVNVIGHEFVEGGEGLWRVLLEE